MGRLVASGGGALREHEAREAARAPWRPVAPEVKEVRRALRTFLGNTIALVVVAHPEMPFEVLESAYARARRGWLRAA